MMLPMFLFETVLEFIWEQISDCIDTITSSPLLLLGVAVFVAGAIIELAKYLLNFGGRD